MPKLYLKNENHLNPAPTESLKPRAHVITNLLNYSKSLQVSTLASGKKTVFNLN